MNSNVRLEPVYDDKGEVVLFDIFIDDEWVGSRRTKKQALMYAGIF